MIHVHRPRCRSGCNQDRSSRRDPRLRRAPRWQSRSVKAGQAVAFFANPRSPVVRHELPPTARPQFHTSPMPYWHMFSTTSRCRPFSRSAHRDVGLFQLRRAILSFAMSAVGAPVILQQVESPRGETGCASASLVLVRAFKFRRRSMGRVNCRSSFQAQRMNVGGERGHVRETGVGQNVACASRGSAAQGRDRLSPACAPSNRRCRQTGSRNRPSRKRSLRRRQRAHRFR